MNLKTWFSWKWPWDQSPTYVPQADPSNPPVPPGHSPAANPDNPSVMPPGYVYKGPHQNSPLSGIMQGASNFLGDISKAGGNLLSGLTMPLTIGLVVGGVVLVLILLKK